MHFFGIGSIIHLREILETEHTAKIFLVVDNNSYSVCGAETALQDLLSGYQVMRFSEFEPDPKIEDVQKGIQMFQKFEPDVVVAICLPSKELFASGVEIEPFVVETVISVPEETLFPSASTIIFDEIVEVLLLSAGSAVGFAVRVIVRKARPH